MFNIAEKDEAAGYVAHAVAKNFDKLPEAVGNNLLFKLAEKDKAAGYVAWAVAENFDTLPEAVGNNLLFKLAEKDKAAGYVAWAVAENFDTLPEAVGNNLLFNIAEKDEAAGYVAFAVAENFDKLPEAVRNLLDRLQEPLQRVIEVLSLHEERWYEEQALQQALHLITNTLSKLSLDFVLKILNKLSDCEHETVRIKASKMLKDIFEDSEDKKEC